MTEMCFEDLPNLASSSLGSEIIFATDEWFAAAENMISDAEAVWKEDLFTPFGKWMDGWESRRRRTEGHDWCIVKLGVPGIIKAIEVDTGFFTGNYSPHVRISGTHLTENSSVMDKLVELRQRSAAERPEFGRMGLCATEEEVSLASQINSECWTDLVPLSKLGAGYEETRKTLFKVDCGSSPISHLRVNMGPDGGITRVRVYGEVVVNPQLFPTNVDIDLAAVENGGLAVSWSNKHYGHPRNLLAPGRGNCMGDGWETARQPLRPAVYKKGADGLMVLPGYDWALLKLGMRGAVSSLEIDTNFFKGNYPESCMVEACLLPKNFPNDSLQTEEQHNQCVEAQWKVLLPRTRLQAGRQHTFGMTGDIPLNNVGSISHIKVTIYPDGGLMRVRVNGRRAPDSRL